MKKLLLFAVSATIFTSCITQKHIPLNGDYQIKDTYSVQKSKEDVWTNIVALFAKNGIGIKIIDKSSGLIISENTLFQRGYKDINSMATFENDKGFIVNKNAFLVCDRNTIGGMEVKTADISGNWNIRVFEKEGNVFVNTNITNVKVYTLSYSLVTHAYEQGTNNYIFNCKSTGVFEKMIFDEINK